MFANFTTDETHTFHQRFPNIKSQPVGTSDVSHCLVVKKYVKEQVMKLQRSLSIAIFAGLLSLNVSAQVVAPEFKVPPDSSIPSGPKGIAIQEGKKLLTETHQRLPKNVRNGLNCTNCHLAGGTVANSSPWVGIWGVFPEYRSRSAKINSLQERVNDCFERSMNGKALPYNLPEMNSILAYMQ